MSRSSPLVHRPARPYCTQKCLAGLKRGLLLDDNCPNVSSHPSRDRYHSVSAAEFAALVEAQLARSVYWGCEPVDEYGLHGKIGAIGALFKVELTSHGYTLVAKGSYQAHRSRLQHEGRIYGQMKQLQGNVVPVHLGLVDLHDGFALPGDAPCVSHMMLLSWCGEPYQGSDHGGWDAQQCRSIDDVERCGVVHNDLRAPNLLWNDERQRVMLIDFDRATLRAPARHKLVARLRGSRAKR